MADLTIHRLQFTFIYVKNAKLVLNKILNIDHERFIPQKI